MASVSPPRTKDHQLLASSVFHLCQEGVIITDPAGVILDVNPAFERITGYSRHEAIGRDTRMLQSGIQGPDFYEAMWASIKSTGHWRGEIWNRKKTGEVYPEILSISALRDDDNQIRNYIAIFLDISGLKEKEDELRKLAFYDPLTGLPNRSLAGDRLRQSTALHHRNGKVLALAYIDLDGFKDINDRFGHEVGDQVLIRVSDNMRRALRESDTLARIGGDEFLAILPDLNAQSDVNILAARLLESARQPIHHRGQLLSLSASMGISFYPQASALDSDQLIRQADQAMYQAKVSGKNCYKLF